jgi:hypothetical protein
LITATRKKGDDMKLIGKWSCGQEPGTEEPSSVIWEDGSPATMADFRTHELDTRILYSNGGETECHMFPDIVADVSFEQNVQDWVMRGQGVVPAALDVKNPNALDCDIYAALITFPTVVYKVRIIRS